jgi:poly(beta-D-mannuronate) lyase
LVPSEVLDLSSWKLNLPTDDQEVLPPQLAGFSDPAFQVAEAVAFTAECGGEAMPGSQYPRSELREMNPDGSNAYWSTTVGQHTMNLTQRITHLPVVKQQLVFAQIHGDPEYLILAEIDQQALYVRYRNSIAGVLDTRYQHGTFFSLSIRASGGYVDVFYNGIHKVHQPLIADGCYFKAGCYLQSNVEKGDLPTAYGQVEISQLTVTHS